jgi:hypothetical protein
MVMKGKWAQGIQPRNFSWIMKGKLAVCERPGGYGTNHRRVRRQEEIIWIREQGFSCVLSIIPSPHNLHNYTELGVTWRHRPFGVHDDPRLFLGALYPELQQLIDSGGCILLHGEELGDRICGAMVGFLVWSGLVPDSPQATMLIEQITSRQVGPVGRELVAITRNMAAERNAARGASGADK